MSPQARRRLSACLHGQEWSDLAQEIVDALAETHRLAVPHATILAALRGDA